MFSSYNEFLGPKVWKFRAPLPIISWSEKLPEYAIFLDDLSSRFEILQAKIGGQMAELEQKWEYKIFFDQNPSKLQGAKRGPFWPIQVLPMVLGDDPRLS